VYSINAQLSYQIWLDFSANVNWEDIFNSTVGNVSYHEFGNDNGSGVVNFVSSKDLTVESIMFPHHSIHKFSWTSNEKTRNPVDLIVIDRQRHSNFLDVRTFRAADYHTV
jgi:hypothetical protein